MAFLWSDPNPSNQTSAALSSPYHVNAESIGPLIGALLGYQKAQQQERDKAFRDLVSGVSSGVQGAYGQYRQGKADDAANAAIYGTQYPNDVYGGFQDPNRVPDYGGVNALRAMDYARKMNPDAFMSDYDKRYAEARIAAQEALANQRNSGGSAGVDAPSMPETYEDENGQVWRRGAGGHWYPMKRSATPKEPKVKMSPEDADAVASIAPEYEPQTVYPSDLEQPKPIESKQSDPVQSANQIRQMWREGKISREDAIKQLQALGFE